MADVNRDKLRSVVSVVEAQTYNMMRLNQKQIDVLHTLFDAVFDGGYAAGYSDSAVEHGDMNQAEVDVINEETAAGLGFNSDGHKLDG